MSGPVVVVSELAGEERATLLRRMADEHVFYEVRGVVRFVTLGQHLRLDVPLLPDGLAGELFDWVDNSTLEAGLVHVRCLVEFLTGSVPNPAKHPPDGNRASDVVAAHYLEREGFKPYRPFVLGTSRERQRELLEEIHQRVMHLTTRRVPEPAGRPYDWRDYIVEQVPSVLDAFRGFLDDLADGPAERCEWFARSDVLLTAIGVRSRRPL